MNRGWNGGRDFGENLDRKLIQTGVKPNREIQMLLSLSSSLSSLLDVGFSWW